MPKCFIIIWLAMIVCQMQTKMQTICGTCSFMVEFMYYDNAFDIHHRDKALVLRLTSNNNNKIPCHYNKVISSSPPSLIQDEKE
jgi:hypothetical protein